MPFNKDASAVIPFKAAISMRPVLRKVAGWAGSAKGDAVFVVLNKVEQLHNEKRERDVPVKMFNLVPCRNAVYSFVKLLETLDKEGPIYKAWYGLAVKAYQDMDEAMKDLISPVPTPGTEPYVEDGYLILGSRQFVENGILDIGDLTIEDGAIILKDGNRVELLDERVPDPTNGVLTAINGTMSWEDE